jgi:C1A family cysteine protease
MYKRLLYLIPLLVLAGVVLHHMSKKRHQVSLEAVNPTAAYDTWIHWKKNHKKYYASPALEKYRFGVFTNNLEQISIYHEMFEAGKS